MQRHYFANKGPCGQSCGFSSGHVWMWELYHKEGWVPKNWCFQIVMLEETEESLRLQGDQTSQSERKSTVNIHWKDWCWSWSFNTLATIRWPAPTHWKKPWCWERLRTRGEGDDRGWDGWMASLMWHEFKQTPEGSEGQGSLACCHPWGRKELDMTEWLNYNSNLKFNNSWRESKQLASSFWWKTFLFQNH